MARTYRIRHLPGMNIAKHFAWSTNKFCYPRIERPPNVPILSPWFHPYVKYSSNTPINVYYRKLAHRKMRRYTNYLLNKSGKDFDNMPYPTWYEYFDRWNFD